MILQVTCPNPDCRHHEKAFEHKFVAPTIKKLATSGGLARWHKMTSQERDEHIGRMVKARLVKKPKKEED